MAASNTKQIRWITGLALLAFGACTYSQPTIEQTNPTSGGGGTTGMTSSSSGDDPDSVSSSASSGKPETSSSSGQPGSSSSSGQPGSSSSSGIPLPIPEKVQCGQNAQCPASNATNDGCCIFEGTYKCGKNVACQGTFFYCDERADCPVGAGLTCCLDPNAAKNANCRPETTCTGPLIPICRTIADCPTPMENCDYTKFGTIGECKP